MKRLLATLLPMLPLLALQAPVHAQVLPQLSLYQFNQFYHNTAYAGAEEKQVIGLTGRRICSKVSDSPTMAVLSYDKPVYKANHGIGFVGTYLTGGATTIGQLGLAYTQNIHFSEYGKLRLGGRLTATHFAIDYDKLPVLPGIITRTGTDNDMGINADAGLWFTYRGFFLGGAANNLFETEFALADSVERRQHRAYNATVGFLFDNFRDVEITPSVMLRADPYTDELVYDASLMLRLQKRVVFGATYRNFGTSSAPTMYTGYPITGFAGVTFDRLQLLLTADVPDSDMNNICGPNYEATIRYRWGGL